MSAGDVRAELARFLNPPAFEEWPVSRPEVQVAAQFEVFRQADVILASDWLAEYVATKQAEALRAAAMDVPFLDPEMADEVIDWLRDRADRIAP